MAGETETVGGRTPGRAAFEEYLGPRLRATQSWFDASPERQAAWERIAGAAVKAAAPDMAEALVAMLEQGERGNWFATGGDFEVVERAYAALRRAGALPSDASGRVG